MDSAPSQRHKDNTQVRRHRISGARSRVHDTHGTLQLDIRLSKQDQERALEEGKAEPHRFVHHEAGWVTFRIRSEGDVETAKELIRLAYGNAEKLMEAHVSRRAQKSS